MHSREPYKSASTARHRAWTELVSASAAGRKGARPTEGKACVTAKGGGAAEQPSPEPQVALDSQRLDFLGYPALWPRTSLPQERREVGPEHTGPGSPRPSLEF